MTTRDTLGGIIHTYQKFDPVNFPSPTAPPPDMVSPAFEHLLMYGSTRRLTEEELARAVRIDPSQIAGLGPSLDALMEILRERKRKILATYETERVQGEAHQNFHEQAEQVRPPAKLAGRFQEAVREEQLHDLERLWYAAGDASTDFSFYTKRATLAGVAAAATLYWLEDRSPGFADTQAFIERRLADLHRLGGLRQRLSEAAERMPNPLRVLRPSR